MAHVTCHMSHVRCRVSRVTCHMSHVTCHLSPVTNGNSDSHIPSPCSPTMHSRLVHQDRNKKKASLWHTIPVSCIYCDLLQCLRKKVHSSKTQISTGTVCREQPRLYLVCYKYVHTTLNKNNPATEFMPAFFD